MTTYPITLPTSSQTQPTTTNFRIVRMVSQSTSIFTGAQQVFMNVGEYWEAEVTLPPMVHGGAREWISSLVSMRGIFGQMYLGDWDGRVARGTAASSAGTPLVKGADQTGNVLLIDGATASQTGYLKAGDYIQLGAGIDQRLHMVTADANSDGSGNVSLSIEPALRSSPADNLAIVVANCKGVFRLSSNETGWNANAVSTYGLTFAVREYLL
jgi:hypothetical protein|tara:strand:+ start:293 stop:928 length:636 start_codon:yes stop_codon:yes gene_type:complete